METCFCENIKGLFETMDIEKRFDSSDHAFMTSVLKNLAFEHAFMIIIWFQENFIVWIKLLLNNQKSCFNNGENTTQNFR